MGVSSFFNVGGHLFAGVWGIQIQLDSIGAFYTANYGLMAK